MSLLSRLREEGMTICIIEHTMHAMMRIADRFVVLEDGRRFEGKPGSNPEELIGAAHAACFTMALSKILGEAGYTAERMDTTAVVTLEQLGDGFAITGVALTLRASVPGLDEAGFQTLAGKAKAGCPVSKLLKADITLDAQLLTA